MVEVLIILAVVAIAIGFIIYMKRRPDNEGSRGPGPGDDPGDPGQPGDGDKPGEGDSDKFE